MPTMFKEMFAFVTLCFTALAKYVRAFDHIGTYVEESSGTFADTARIERQQRVAHLMSSINQGTQVIQGNQDTQDKQVNLGSQFIKLTK